MLEARYGERDKTAALDDARDLERESGVEGVRVILEVHNPGTGESQERTVYMSAALRKARGQGNRAGGGAGGDSQEMVGGAAVTPFDDDDDDDDDGEEKVSRGWVSSLFRRRQTHIDDDLVGAVDQTDADTDDSGSIARVPRRPIRASRVVMKFMLIVVASFGIATATTFLYTWTL